MIKRFQNVTVNYQTVKYNSIVTFQNVNILYTKIKIYFNTNNLNKNNPMDLYLKHIDSYDIQ